MIQFSGSGILLDIEGTTSSISFVYDEMFPFIRRDVKGYVAANWNSAEMDGVRALLARHKEEASFDEWCGEGTTTEDAQAKLLAEVFQLMDADRKSTWLKQLQGLVWRSGFESGELQAHVYEDVTPALELWNKAGLDVRIYSSGSVEAQTLFFGHSIAGNLLGHFRGHYDTTTGPKKEAESYRKIAADFGIPPAEILFLSDIPEELDAAREAGLQTGLSIRPGNKPIADDVAYVKIKSFDEIVLPPEKNPIHIDSLA